MIAPLPLEEAQARLLALAVPLPVERVDVAGALGRWLAEPLVARRTQPPADCSAMDGYAVRESDLTGPWRIIGESAAGHPFAGRVGPGQAVRISTGALLPAGADSVVLQEDVVRDGNMLRFAGEDPVRAGRHIRRAGSDFAEGRMLAPAGTRIGPAHVALALTAGHRLLPVRRPARIAIIDSGDELAADPEHCPAHQVPASNAAMIEALLGAVPCEVTRTGPIADDQLALCAAFDAAGTADVIVTSGGASVGDHDLIRPALAGWGAESQFWRIAIKPGKPLLVARRAGQIVLGLPGNPVSAQVTAFLFLLPLVRALGGAAEVLPRAISATLGAGLAAGGVRREFLRAQWDGAAIAAAQVQDSGALAALAQSNALIDRPAAGLQLPAGATVAAYLFANGGIA